MAKRKSAFSKTNKGNSKYSLPPSRNRHLQQEEQEAITKFHDVDNEFDDNNVKVWNEEELDRYDNLNENSKREYEEVDNDDDSENEWTKPSAHEKLLSIFKNRNKHFKKFYKREKLEQEGIELSEMNNSEDEKEQEEQEDINENKSNEDNEDNEENEENEDNNEEIEERNEENEEEEEIDINGSDDEKDENDTTDRYQIHFNEKVSEDISVYAAQVDTKEYEIRNFETPILKQCSIYELKNKKITENKSNMKNLDELNIKKRLQELFIEMNKPVVKADENESDEIFTDLQKSLFHYINNYNDILYSNSDNSKMDEIRSIYTLHALNHVFKTRDKILKNSEKIKHLQEKGEDIPDIRDQGFTRPKVLILLPYKNTALDIMEKMIKISGSKQVENKKRLHKEFKLSSDEDSDMSDKPEDYRKIFRGNIDDCFRVGIKFTRKSMRFFADFYQSDIIVASPLGIRMIIGAEGEKKRDYDFLSSIELLIIDQCQDLLMQNWDHLLHILNYMHLIPKATHDTDFSRIKNWYLDSKAKYLCQNLIFTEYLTPELNSLFNTHFKNISGKIKIRHQHYGTINDVIIPVQQTYHRIATKSIKHADDDRFNFFIYKVLPNIQKSVILQMHTAIYVPSYFDFIRIRNYMDDNDYSYHILSEYTEPADISRARSDFYHGRVRYILMTERFQYFRRYRIRGIQNIIFYGLPDHANFFSEMLNNLAPPKGEEGSDVSCTVLYTKYDRLKLERVVGFNRVQKLCNSMKSDTFMIA